MGGIIRSDLFCMSAARPRRFDAAMPAVALVLLHLMKLKGITSVTRIENTHFEIQADNLFSL